MSEFRTCVDQFLAREKRVVGQPVFRQTQMNDVYDLVWGIEEATGLTANRVQIKTLFGTPQSFVVMVSLWWEPKQAIIPIFRLMKTPPKEPHFNMPPLPAGVDFVSVIGPRYYPWSLNRDAFRLKMPGLPYAVPLPRNLEDFHNAIRYACGECGVQLGDAILPDFPASGRLL